MPELPEVETVCHYLRNHILCKQICQIKSYVAKLRFPLPATLTLAIQILQVQRSGKYIQIFCSNKTILLFHLGMTGKLYLVEPEHQRTKHEHLELYLTSQQRLIFQDVRKFGCFTILQPTKENLLYHKLLAKVGVEPLTAAFKTQTLQQLCLQAKSRKIKVLLMDNSLLTGVGNIYASEALFASNIHPARPAQSLKLSECQQLVHNIKRILLHAIELGGTTVKDYSYGQANQGYFSQHLQVYQRANEPCYACQTLITKITLGGRSSFLCPTCQPEL